MNVSAHEPDRGDLARFVNALFRYADPGGFASIRAFLHERNQPPPYIRATCINGAGLDAVVSGAMTGARKAAASGWVLAPPVATFTDSKRATEEALANGLAISLDLDSGNPREALRRLEGLLGPATVVVASGGETADPKTGELQAKLHAHWRLSEPTRTAAEHLQLKRARQLAGGLAGSDPTMAPPVHPVRWPGSWHLKDRTKPRLARIVALNEGAEVHLGEALELLELAAEAAGAGQAGGGPRKPRPNGSRSARELQAPVEIVRSALEALPNPDAHWDTWNTIGLLAYAATGGSPEGMEAWERWSATSQKHDPSECEARWRCFHRSPPTRGGAGSIFYLARQHGWQDPRRARREEPPPHDAVPPWAAAEPESAPPSGKESSQKPADPSLTEDGIAQIFAEQFRTQLRFDHHSGKWHRWDGVRWLREETRLAFDWMRTTCRTLAQDAKADGKIAAILGRANTASAIERFAQADRAFAVTSEIWDRDPFLLGTPGGTVDLRTGKLRPAKQSDFITKICAVTPAETPDCPKWLQFLDEATGQDKGMIRFIQQWLGYTLTGDTREHALLFVFGSGGNGKSVLLNTISGILGDYCRIAPMEAFTASNSDRHATELAMLKGARLVCASETEEGRAWAESRIKQLTGGDRIAARFMRQDFFEFTPQFKLTIVGNNKPVLRNVDDAARRRINMLPFTRKPPKPDKQLEQKLRAEWPAILRWIIDGCLDWQANGLVRPTSVTEATNEYFSEQDTMRQWIDDCCDTTDLPPKAVGHALDTNASLFSSWRAYASARGEEVGSAKRFSTALQRLGYAPIKDEYGIRGRGWRGIRVRVQPGSEWP